MNLLVTDAQEQLIDATSRFLRDANGLDPSAAWRGAAELGILGVGITEERGGQGGTTVEEALVFRELGRVNAVGPFLGVVLGAHLAEIQAPRLTRHLVGGQRSVGIALQHGTATGEGLLVLDGVDAELVLQLTATEARLVDVTSSARDDRPCIDGTHSLARIDLDAGHTVATAVESDTHLLRRARILAGAMASGICQATCAMAVEYASHRHQFGAPIGVNQAVQHQCADMAVRSEVSTAAVNHAALLDAYDHPDADVQAAAAALVAARAALDSAAANIQVHGAIGFTFEHPAQRYLCRANVLESVLGPRREHVRAVLRLTRTQEENVI